tara:strand:+ start:34 stop:936 length:903 start_codon:yes stop_codon:yes gene_type:complete
MNIDLDIENYDLQDILNLFKLDINFNNDDLIAAKKIVLKTHPDKSGLDKDIFLFYCKAFKILKNINDFRNKEEKCLYNRDSKYVSDYDDESNKEIVDNAMKKKGDFNKWFNKLFEKLNLNDSQEDGYGEWLKCNDNENDNDNDNENDNESNNKNNNLNTMHQKIENRKRKMSQLVRKNDYYTLEYGGSQYLLDGNNNFNSDIFSNLKYQDLKNAHTDSLIPVCNEDYDNRLKFNNVNAYKQYRDQQNIKSLSKEDSENILNREYSKNQDIATNVAYKLLKEDEINREKNKLWWSNLKLLS